MSKTTKPIREPKVSLCERSEHKFLSELERLISDGYRINFDEQFCVFPGCLIASLVLKNENFQSI